MGARPESLPEAERSGSLAERFRAHAAALRRAGRSPLYVVLMTGAADDIDGGGVVAELFDGLSDPPGSVPQLRLLGALHELVLTGQVPQLARCYPSAGGMAGPEEAWPVARAVLREHFAWIRERLPRTVQTNEPGRAAVLFAALLWLAERDGRPIRLLEIGASAGLNLLSDRFAYAVDGRVLGEPSSVLRFEQPWQPPPPVDLDAAQRRLRIVARAGCDLAPLNARSEPGRRRLRSYIWPDERERLQRLDDALAVAAACDPVPIAAAPASAWLDEMLPGRRAGELTVVWHSVMRQYVAADEWARVLERLDAAGGDPDRPVVRLAMEPRADHQVGFGLSLDGEALARCRDHGPPVRWEAP